MAAPARRLLLLNHEPTTTPASSSSSSSSSRQSFPTLLPVFILFILLLCFLSIFLVRDLLHFLSLCLRRRRRLLRHGEDHDSSSVSMQSPGSPINAQAPRKPPGLDPAILASFPMLRFKASAAAAAVAPECAVCLSDFAAGDALRLLTVCRHAFHTPCIDSWLRAHTTCPVCRSDLDAPAPAPRHEDPAAVAVDVECDRRGGAG